MMLHILSLLVSVAEFIAVLCLLSRAQAYKHSICSYVTFLKFGIDFSAFRHSVFDVYMHESFEMEGRFILYLSKESFILCIIMIKLMFWNKQEAELGIIVSKESFLCIDKSIIRKRLEINTSKC